MDRYLTEQERIDNMTMRIENANVVGSGFVRYPPQKPQQDKAAHRQHPTSPSYLGGGGGRHSQYSRQGAPMHRGMTNPGPPQLQNLHQFNPAAAQQRFMHQQHNGYHTGGSMGHQSGFSPQVAGLPAGYRPHSMDAPLQGGIYQQQISHNAMLGYNPEGGTPYQNGMGMMGRGMAARGMMQHGLGGGMASRPGYVPHQLPHPQSLPQGSLPVQGGMPHSRYLEQGLEQGLQPGFESRAMDNGLVNRQQQYHPQTPGYVPPAHTPTSGAHLVPQFAGGENGHQHFIAQQQQQQHRQQQQQSMQHIRVPQVAARPASLDNDGSRSPAVNYQPPPPHKAPAPIGTPLPGSLATKTSPPRPLPGKSGLGVPSVRPTQASHATMPMAPQQPQRPGSVRPTQPTPSRAAQPQALAPVAPRPTAAEVPTHQAPKAVVPRDSDEEHTEQSDSMNGDKEGLTKRQKTRLRKKLREQHLKKQPAQKAVRGS